MDASLRWHDASENPASARKLRWSEDRDGMDASLHCTTLVRTACTGTTLVRTPHPVTPAKAGVHAGVQGQWLRSDLFSREKI